ncbi:hypothetical protein HYPSUDRAFT_68142 [Hypholoma sublateritium FD-334 SS-4]|uniref:C2 domain-containing protein n=1 Tax=Hypholoma sublateritium (strain FD-334 SS-4) TaxID=945553 RepID=A0A0D2NWE7_HYPSF|nr:hypothetical protein HYPSUDRAFT_68142 [Hypholoma sublateritium FD-334 SS-4]
MPRLGLIRRHGRSELGKSLDSKEVSSTEVSRPVVPTEYCLEIVQGQIYDWSHGDGEYVKPNAYVEISVNAELVCTTSTQPQTITPVWNKTIAFKSNEPTNVITVKMYHSTGKGESFWSKSITIRALKDLTSLSDDIWLKLFDSSGVKRATVLIRLGENEIGHDDFGPVQLEHIALEAPPKSIDLGSGMNSGSPSDPSTWQWYYMRIVKVQIPDHLTDQNRGAREDAEPGVYIKVLVGERTIITSTMQSQTTTHIWDEPAIGFYSSDNDSESVVKIGMYHFASSSTSPSGHGDDKLLYSRSIAIQDLEKLATASKDISLDLLDRGIKRVIVAVQFGKLEPGLAFAQARISTEPVASDSMPSDIGRLRKIKHVGIDRDERLVGHLGNRLAPLPLKLVVLDREQLHENVRVMRKPIPASKVKTATGRDELLVSQEQDLEARSEGPNNVQPSDHVHREYKVQITFKNMGEDNIRYSYSEKNEYIEDNLEPHFISHPKTLLLHTVYNFEFTRGRITKRVARSFTREIDVDLAEYF